MSDAVAMLQQPIAFTAVIAVLGLVVGSFLNVVIHRLPIMMERSWRAQCRELLAGEAQATNGEQGSESAAEPPFNLVQPRSRCPHCGHPIGALENIPLISYLFLGGRCRACGARISPRYPLVELVTAALSAIAAWHFGPGWAALAAVAFTWALVALTFVDLDHHLLPDDITLPLLWSGLLISLGGVFVGPRTALIGAAAGYLILWTVYQLFRLVTGKEGMGFGDFKLLAALGAWMGWQALPLIILLSSVVGAAVGIAMIVVRGRDRTLPIPFGPYLAAAGWISLLWGHELIRLYLGVAGHG